MIVDVHGLELFGRHGVNDDERRDGQERGDHTGYQCTGGSAAKHVWT